VGLVLEPIARLGTARVVPHDLGVRERFEQTQSDLVAVAVRTSLGKEAFAAAFGQGRGMSAEEVASFAFQATDLTVAASQGDASASG
jgi:hypothetical protein